jgi:uncharacterized iron-regulated membrane protein
MITALYIAAGWIVCGLVAGLVVRSRWKKKEGRNKFVVRWGPPERSKDRKKMRAEIARFIIGGPISLAIQILGTCLLIIMNAGSELIDYLFGLR